MTKTMMRMKVTMKMLPVPKAMAEPTLKLRIKKIPINMSSQHPILIWAIKVGLFDAKDRG